MDTQHTRIIGFFTSRRRNARNDRADEPNALSCPPNPSPRSVISITLTPYFTNLFLASVRLKPTPTSVSNSSGSTATVCSPELYPKPCPPRSSIFIATSVTSASSPASSPARKRPRSRADDVVGCASIPAPSPICVDTSLTNPRAASLMDCNENSNSFAANESLNMRSYASPSSALGVLESTPSRANPSESAPARRENHDPSRAVTDASRASPPSSDSRTSSAIVDV
mmetsp:Transcript_3916/g.14222  ORF Transcript_3916/g.14222 Transcript_3916/m.14222 type:complete len:227 (-) Transcript_3916:27-707(-)